MPRRRYLKEIPEALSKGEWEAEMREKNRKKSIFIRGIRTVGRGIKEEIKGILKEYLGLDAYINKARAIGGGIVIELAAMENKVEIMKKKGN